MSQLYVVGRKARPDDIDIIGNSARDMRIFRGRAVPDRPLTSYVTMGQASAITAKTGVTQQGGAPEGVAEGLARLRAKYPWWPWLAFGLAGATAFMIYRNLR